MICTEQFPLPVACSLLTLMLALAVTTSGDTEKLPVCGNYSDYTWNCFTCKENMGLSTREKPRGIVLQCLKQKILKCSTSFKFKEQLCIKETFEEISYLRIYEYYRRKKSRTKWFIFTPELKKALTKYLKKIVFWMNRPGFGICSSCINSVDEWAVEVQKQNCKERPHFSFQDHT